MPFSWVDTLAKQLIHKQKIAMTLAKKQDAEFKMHHPDEARDAVQKNFTKLKIRIKDEHEKNIKKVMERRKKIGNQ